MTQQEFEIETNLSSSKYETNQRLNSDSKTAFQRSWRYFFDTNKSGDVDVRQLEFNLNSLTLENLLWQRFRFEFNILDARNVVRLNRMSAKCYLNLFFGKHFMSKYVFIYGFPLLFRSTRLSNEFGVGFPSSS